MPYFPTSAIIYIFSGTMSLIYSLRHLALYRKTRNEYSKMFFWLGIWAAAGLYLFGMPSLIDPRPYFIKSILFFLGSISTFLGVNQPVRVALMAWGKTAAAGQVKILVPAGASLIAIFNALMAMPASFTDSFGFIHWDVAYPFNVIWFTSGVLTTIVPAIFLFTARTESQKAIVKKTLFSITFLLGGLGGWSVLIFQDIIPLAISFTLLFLGFCALAGVILIDIFMKEEKTEETKKQIFASDA